MQGWLAGSHQGRHALRTLPLSGLEQQLRQLQHNLVAIDGLDTLEIRFTALLLGQASTIRPPIPLAVSSLLVTARENPNNSAWIALPGATEPMR